MPAANHTDPVPVHPEDIGAFIEVPSLPMIAVEGPDHTVRTANAGFCRLVGRSRDDLLARPFVQIASNGEKYLLQLDAIIESRRREMLLESNGSRSELPTWLCVLWPGEASGKAPQRVVIQLTSAERSHLDVAAVNEALLVGALRQHELRVDAEQSNARLEIEVSERKNAEEALHNAIEELTSAREAAERGSRAKDDFIATLSHELRTPLTPVLFATEALREEDRLPPKVREQLAMIERNVRREARLIDDLLDVTKIAHGHFDLRVEECDTHSLITLAIDMVRDEALLKRFSQRQPHPSTWYFPILDSQTEQDSN